MSDCEVEVAKWRDNDLYRCHRCNIRTVDEAAYLRRCHARREPRATSNTGLLGPTGQPLPSDEPQPVGGGWYELPTGERVQGREAAIEAMQPTSHDEA
jgi:hypothetical protein